MGCVASSPAAREDEGSEVLPKVHESRAAVGKKEQSGSWADPAYMLDIDHRGDTTTAGSSTLTRLVDSRSRSGLAGGCTEEAVGIRPGIRRGTTGSVNTTCTAATTGEEATCEAAAAAVATACAFSAVEDGQSYQHYLLGAAPPGCNVQRGETLAALGLDSSDPFATDEELACELHRIVVAVQRLMGAASAFLAVLGEAQVFAATTTGGGIEIGPFPWRWSFCAYAMTKPLPTTFVVPDALKDARFCHSRAVQLAPFVRFYAGAPIVASNGHIMGTLSFMDTAPREAFSTEQCMLLNNMAELAARQLEARTLSPHRAAMRSALMLQPGSAAAAAAASDARVQQAFRHVARSLDCYEAAIALVDTTLPGWPVVYANEAWTKQFAQSGAANSGAGSSGEVTAVVEQLRGADGPLGCGVVAVDSAVSGTIGACGPQLRAGRGPGSAAGVASGCPSLQQMLSSSVVTSCWGGLQENAAMGRRFRLLGATRAVVPMASAQGTEASVLQITFRPAETDLVDGEALPVGVPCTAPQHLPSPNAGLAATMASLLYQPPAAGACATLVQPHADAAGGVGSPKAAAATTLPGGPQEEDGSGSPLDSAASMRPSATWRYFFAKAVHTPAHQHQVQDERCTLTCLAGQHSDDDDDDEQEDGGNGSSAYSSTQRSARPYVLEGLKPAASREGSPPASAANGQGRCSPPGVSAASAGNGAAAASVVWRTRPQASTIMSPGKSAVYPAASAEAVASAARAQQPPRPTPCVVDLPMPMPAPAPAMSDRQPAPSRGWLPGDQPIRGLLLGPLLGKGGYGTVFRATYYGKAVAAKVVPNKYVLRAVNGVTTEALLGQDMHHPHLVRILKCVVVRAPHRMAAAPSLAATIFRPLTAAPAPAPNRPVPPPQLAGGAAPLPLSLLGQGGSRGAPPHHGGRQGGTSTAACRAGSFEEVRVSAAEAARHRRHHHHERQPAHQQLQRFQAHQQHQALGSSNVMNAADDSSSQLQACDTIDEGSEEASSALHNTRLLAERSPSWRAPLQGMLLEDAMGSGSAASALFGASVPGGPQALGGSVSVSSCWDDSAACLANVSSSVVLATGRSVGGDGLLGTPLEVTIAISSSSQGAASARDSGGLSLEPEGAGPEQPPLPQFQRLARSATAALPASGDAVADDASNHVPTTNAAHPTDASCALNTRHVGEQSPTKSTSDISSGDSQQRQQQEQQQQQQQRSSPPLAVGSPTTDGLASTSQPQLQRCSAGATPCGGAADPLVTSGSSLDPGSMDDLSFNSNASMMLLGPTMMEMMMDGAATPQQQQQQQQNGVASPGAPLHGRRPGSGGKGDIDSARAPQYGARDTGGSGSGCSPGAKRRMLSCPGETWIVMEMCSVGSLQDALDRGAFRTSFVPPVTPSTMSALQLTVTPGPNATPAAADAAGPAAVGAAAAGPCPAPLPCTLLPHAAPATPLLPTPPIDLDAVLATAYEVASAIEALHLHNVVHGDLSAFNVLLAHKPPPQRAAQHAYALAPERGFVAKVSDFGLARMMGASAYVKTHAYGTLTHAAPEVLVSGSLSQAADVWSFGVLLWQLYTGSRPWAGLSHARILHIVAVQKRPLVFPMGAPARYHELATRCMAAEPHLRPSFGHICDELRAMMAWRSAPQAHTAQQQQQQQTPPLSQGMPLVQAPA